MTVKAIIQLAESGGPDDLFVDPPRTSLEVIAHRVNIDAFGEKGARAIEEAAGGAAPLLERLRTYVQKRPSNDDPPGKDDAHIRNRCGRRHRPPGTAGNCAEAYTGTMRW
jgi:hypothetical protein